MSLLRTVLLDESTEELAAQELGEQLDEFIGEVYDPAEEFE